jgi:tetratricopeptide (TPR) repeat protein
MRRFARITGRQIVAALLAVACCACTPQAQILMSLIPDGTVPVLLSHFDKLEDANRRRVAELEQRRDWSGLAKLAEDNIKIDATNSDWWIVAGYAYAQLGDRKRASECYAEVVRLTPDDMLGWSLLTQSYRLGGQPERAVQSANRALNVRRDSAEVWYLLGESYSDLGRLELAVKSYREALQLEDRFDYAWFGLGKAYARLGRDAEMKQAIKALGQINPAMAKELAAQQASRK